MVWLVILRSEMKIVLLGYWLGKGRFGIVVLLLWLGYLFPVERKQRKSGGSKCFAFFDLLLTVFFSPSFPYFFLERRYALT